MSTTLIVLASILAISAIVLILFMTAKDTRQQKNPNAHMNPGTTHQKKKRKEFLLHFLIM